MELCAIQELMYEGRTKPEKVKKGVDWVRILKNNHSTTEMRHLLLILLWDRPVSCFRCHRRHHTGI